MKLFDVNIFVYAYRNDIPEHAFYKSYLEKEINKNVDFAVSDFILSGFLRVVTHPKIFKTPALFDHAEEFTRIVRENPNAIALFSDNDHWEIFTELCKKIKARGNIIADCYIAALAISTGCELVSADRDYDRFKDLKVIHPADL